MYVEPVLAVQDQVCLVESAMDESNLALVIANARRTVCTRTCGLPFLPLPAWRVVAAPAIPLDASEKRGDNCAAGLDHHG